MRFGMMTKCPLSPPSAPRLMALVSILSTACGDATAPGTKSGPAATLRVVWEADAWDCVGPIVDYDPR
ncbi:MAG: hypothetical protein ABI565_04595 [Vicinamibacteria bacterium]